MGYKSVPATTVLGRSSAKRIAHSLMPVPISNTLEISGPKRGEIQFFIEGEGE
jgi:hypothetical protein